MQVGETIFTVISVESDLAKESLYNKVKRMILDSGSNKINTADTYLRIANCAYVLDLSAIVW